MTTLTANVPLLPEHCAHKLPTSCGLTALPTCCACQDKRAHSSSYSKYIDGIGFVSGGTRQERYCWMCKEFWNARIGASRMRQSDTRIPESPNQSDFLKHWYDWHRGYKITKHEDGSEEHQLLLGERLEDTVLGHLPRTLDELHSGIVGDSGNQESYFIDSTTPEPDDLEIDPEDRLFDPPTTGLDAPNISSLYIGSHPSNPTAQISSSDGDVERQGADYESAVRGRNDYRLARLMLHQVERSRERHTDRLEALITEDDLRGENIARVGRSEAAAQDLDTSLDPTTVSETTRSSNEQDSSISNHPLGSSQATVAIFHNLFRPSDPWTVQRQALGDNEFSNGSGSEEDEDDEDENALLVENRGLDKDGRPEALKEEDLVVKLECKICYTQLASIAVIPCGHLVMCKWCADEHVPSHPRNRTQPAKKANCPVCRKRITQKITTYTC